MWGKPQESQTLTSASSLTNQGLPNLPYESGSSNSHPFAGHRPAHALENGKILGCLAPWRGQWPQLSIGRLLPSRELYYATASPAPGRKAQRHPYGAPLQFQINSSLRY